MGLNYLNTLLYYIVPTLASAVFTRQLKNKCSIKFILLGVNGTYGRLVL